MASAREYAPVAHGGQALPTLGEAFDRRLGYHAFEVVATWHYHDHVGARFRDLLGRHPKRRLARAAQHILAAGLRHHLRHPVPAHVEWVEPFEAQHARPRTRLRRLSFRSRPLAARALCEGLRLATPTGRFSHAANVVPDIGERMRRERQDTRLLGKARECGRQIVGRGGADVAQILRHDQIGRNRRRSSASTA